MSPKISYSVLYKINDNGKDHIFSKLFREELEDAFSKTMGDNCMSKNRGDAAFFTKYSFTLDDNKVHFNYAVRGMWP